LYIELTLGGALVKYLPSGGKGNQVSLTVAEKTTVADVLSQLEVPPETRMMVILDGNLVAADDFVTKELQNDAKLSVIQPIQAG